MSETIMHVGIEEPVRKRKDILNIAIDAIQTLKEFEMYRKITKEKDIYRKQFIQVVEELSKAIQEFKELMPIVHVHPPKEEAVKPEGKVEPIKKIPVKKKAKMHLDELEDDINLLREKIARL